MSGRSLWILILGLTILAAVPRLVNLDSLSFYGDEETSAYPARALAEGTGAVMPSGMEYRRGLTLTWMAAGAASVLGLDSEASYRLPSAVLGTLTVPLLFLFGRRYLGAGPALVAAAALALSEWHLVYSRMARMYVPLVFFLLVTAYAIWIWAESGRARDLLLAAVAFAAAVLTHSLAVFAVLFALIPIGLNRNTKASSLALGGFALAGVVAARLYNRLIIAPPFAAQLTPPPADGSQAVTAGSWIPEALSGALGPPWLFAAVGFLLGAWSGMRTLPMDEFPETALRMAGMVITASISGALLAGGQFWGASAFALVFLVVHTDRRLSLLRRAWPPLLGSAALGVVTVAADVATLGMVEGMKQALVYPFPYLVYLFRAFPGVVVLFAGVCVWAALRPYRSRQFGIRGVVLATLLLVVAVGLFRGWAQLRFLLPAHPFLLLTAAVGLTACLSWAARRLGRLPRWSGVAGAMIIVLSGLLGGHGVAAAWDVATLRHGEPVQEAVHQEAFRPDHEAAGRFVREARRPGDLVVAEDPLQQHWYAGPVDYWFRSYRDSQAFLSEAPDGSYRDIYVGSTLIPNLATLDSIVGDTDGRAWFITSGETIDERDYYLDPDQRRWLDSLERTRQPDYVARDSATKVFCLNCP